MEDLKLGILSVFRTVDGECNIWGPGHWSVFIRTRGCSVGCVWCDTKYSWGTKGGLDADPKALFDVVREVGNGIRKVTITGGEPLEQDWNALYSFINLLVQDKYNITVETAGTQNTIRFRRGFALAYPETTLSLGQLSFIVDFKLGSSQYKGTMDDYHFKQLPRGDIVKFVIDSNVDFVEAKFIAMWLDEQKTFHAQMFFSPSHGKMTPKHLFNLLQDSGLPEIGVGLNLQMQKYIFPVDSRDEEDGGLDFTKRGLGRKEFLKQAHDKK